MLSIRCLTVYDSAAMGQFWLSMNIWVFPKIEVPQNGWFLMENPIKMDGCRVPPFWKHLYFLFASQFPICCYMGPGAFGVHAKATSAELIKHFCRLDGLRKLMPMPSCGEPCPTNDFKPMVGETKKKHENQGHGISFAGPATLYNSSI